jgi:putative oxidoreductase
MNKMPLISKQDFKLSGQNFDLTNEFNILRIVCGLFLIPHALGKIDGGGFNPFVLDFFTKAGFHPPELWVGLALLAEAVSALGLILGLCSRWAAVLAGVVLAIAAGSLHIVGGGLSWIWIRGGYEYPVFWSITCFVVALHEFKRARNLSKA